MPEVSKRWWLRWSLLAPAVVLTGAVAMQAMGGMREVAKARCGNNGTTAFSVSSRLCAFASS